jgi:hypothetical protein
MSSFAQIDCNTFTTSAAEMRQFGIAMSTVEQRLSPGWNFFLAAFGLSPIGRTKCSSWLVKIMTVAHMLILTIGLPAAVRWAELQPLLWARHLFRAKVFATMPAMRRICPLAGVQMGVGQSDRSGVSR